jgi:hypothetical protein
MVLKKLRKVAKWFYDRFYVKIFADYRTELCLAVGDCKTLLDVGCGAYSPIQNFSNQLHCEGVDGFLPSIETSQAKGIHKKYHQMDLFDIGERFLPNTYECVLASDVIEHFEKEDGWKLLEHMEKIASKRVIIYTPNGFLPQGEYDNNAWQVHKSGWEIEEMEKRGYRVLGIHGHKIFRGEYAKIKWKPWFFWQIISDVSQLWTRSHTKNAFQILCVKDMPEISKDSKSNVEKSNDLDSGSEDLESDEDLASVEPSVEPSS